MPDGSKLMFSDKREFARKIKFWESISSCGTGSWYGLRVFTPLGRFLGNVRDFYAKWHLDVADINAL